MHVSYQQTFWVMFLEYLLLTLLCSLCNRVFADRIHCLQNELGKEKNDTLWEQSQLFDSNLAAKGWMYTNKNCPLHILNRSDFCQRSIGCGKSLLLVGDSTVKELVEVLPNFLDGKHTRTACPTRNGCAKNSPRVVLKDRNGCIDGMSIVPIFNTVACQQFCPLDQPVTITYVRHDFLSGYHGLHYYRTSACDEWKNIASRYDIVLVSIGPHVDEMVEFPYNVPPPPDFNATTFFQTESEKVAKELIAAIKPSATVIYRTGPVGALVPLTDCDVPPLSYTPFIHPNFHWDKIPAMNNIYIRALQRVLKERLFVMDTTTLLSKMEGCRRDHMHFQMSGGSPVMLEWVILHNLLLELHHNHTPPVRH